MRAAMLHGAGDVRVADVVDLLLCQPTDALVRVRVAAMCGSDLWAYRDREPFQPGARLGHESIGTVEDLGAQVTRVRRGDVVVAPFAFADGTCRACSGSLHTSCARGGIWGRAFDGGQCEVPRGPLANATLVPVRVDADAGRERRLLAPTDAERVALAHRFSASFTGLADDPKAIARLADIAGPYRLMDERLTVKALVRP